MVLSSYTRYVDALLLLSINVGEKNGEEVVISTSCVSSTVLSELQEMGYLDHAEMSGNFVISKKGRQVLKQVKYAPWGTIDVQMSPPSATS